ncbi:hypothetical protein ABIF50_003283 [Bradyrhizobium diazoefficiens]|jgi:hypothetical protein|uniref:Uncharacterized protein n=1 Tax=Bradyrhizobium diazoefficiens TaxID=1355477 RepID=A0A0E4FUD4_9BRAD|nr:hypothetical protein NK6_2888 [Bradyrhizobium diazoefficiens]
MILAIPVLVIRTSAAARSYAASFPHDFPEGHATAYPLRIKQQ